MNTILLTDAPAAAGNGSGGDMINIIFLIAIIAIFYFLMIRPQQKRQKKLREERASIAKGDRIITAGGIYGRVVSVNDNDLMVEIDNNVKIRVAKNSVYKDLEEAARDQQQKDSK